MTKMILQKKLELLLKISLHPQKFKSKPTGHQSAIISSSIADFSREIDIKSFSLALEEGQTWTSLFAGKRLTENWVSQQVFAVDLDNDNHSQNSLLAIADLHCISPSLIHESFSSTNDFKKWRVIFITDSPITDKNKALGIQKKLSLIFKSDTAVCDLSRIFYGTNKKISYLCEEARLDLDDLGELPLTQLKKENEAINDIPLCEQKEVLIRLKRNHIGRFYLINKVIEEQIESVKNLSEGSGYESVFKASLRLGRFRELGSIAILETIVKTIKETSYYDNWQHLDNVEQIINKGIQYGRKYLYD